MALENLIAVSKYIRERYPFRIRLNTNGLSDLIHKRSTAEEICQAVDSISISLNMPDAASYNEVVRPTYGEKSFDAMLKFARDCKQYLDDVRFTVVDVIGEEKVEQSKILAAQNGIPLRVRKYSLSRFYNTSVTVFPFSPKFKPGCVAKKHSPVLSLIILMLFSPFVFRIQKRHDTASLVILEQFLIRLDNN